MVCLLAKVYSSGPPNFQGSWACIFTQADMLLVLVLLQIVGISTYGSIYFAEYNLKPPSTREIFLWPWKSTQWMGTSDSPLLTDFSSAGGGTQTAHRRFLNVVFHRLTFVHSWLNKFSCSSCICPLKIFVRSHTFSQSPPPRKAKQLPHLFRRTGRLSERITQKPLVKHFTRISGEAARKSVGF